MWQRNFEFQKKFEICNWATTLIFSLFDHSLKFRSQFTESIAHRNTEYWIHYETIDPFHDTKIDLLWDKMQCTRKESIAANPAYKLLGALASTCFHVNAPSSLKWYAINYTRPKSFLKRCLKKRCLQMGNDVGRKLGKYF